MAARAKSIRGCIIAGVVLIAVAAPPIAASNAQAMEQRNDIERLMGAYCFKPTDKKATAPVCKRMKNGRMTSDAVATQAFRRMFWPLVPDAIKAKTLSMMDVVSPFGEVTDRDGAKLTDRIEGTACIAHNCGGNEVLFLYERSTGKAAVTITRYGEACRAYREAGFARGDDLCP